MRCRASRCRRQRFPPEIIQHAVWLYCRFNLSHRDLEDIPARHGVLVTHDSIRLWCNKFGLLFAQRPRRGHCGYGDSVFMDEVFIRIRGRQRYRWRAVDQDGEVVDVPLQERRDAASARRFFGHLLGRLRRAPRAVVTDKLGSYAVARREPLPTAAHDTRRYANNRAALSHQAMRVRERGMRRFKSVFQAQRLVHVHAAVSNLCNLGRHLVAAGHYRTLRRRAYASWDGVVAM